MAGFTISEGATKGDGIRACLWAGAKMDDHHTSILFDRCAIMPDETPATLRKPGHPTEFIGQPFLKVDLKGTPVHERIRPPTISPSTGP